MKTLIAFFFILWSTSAFAQYPQASVTDINVKVRADRITAEYNKHLGLTGIQIPLFKNKVARYLVLADEIKRNNEGLAEQNALIEMRANESAAMSDILELYQQRLYLKLKPEIQPLQ